MEKKNRLLLIVGILLAVGLALMLLLPSSDEDDTDRIDGDSLEIMDNLSNDTIRQTPADSQEKARTDSSTKSKGKGSR